MFEKIKIKGTRIKDFQGHEAFMIPEGSIVEVLYGGTDNINKGDIIVRTNNYNQPFYYIKPGNNHKIPVAKGTMWGSSLENYSFRWLVDKTLADYQ